MSTDDRPGTVTDPDGDRTELSMDRTSLDSYEATVPGGTQGVYAVSLRLHDGHRPLPRHDDGDRSYSPEYGSSHADHDLAQRIAAAGRGRVDPDADAAFAPVDLPRGEGSRDIAAWFVLGAVVLLPLEIGLRRLRLERQDLRRLTTWVRRGIRRPQRRTAPGRDDDRPPPPDGSEHREDQEHQEPEQAEQHEQLDATSADGVRGLLDAKRRARERRDPR